MIIDTDQIASSIKRYKAQLRNFSDRLEQNDPLVPMDIARSYIIDVGIESSLVDMMTAEAIIDSVNRAGNNWVKVAYCAQLMLICGQDAEIAEELLDLCYENIDEEIREDDFFDIDCQF